MPHDPAAWRGEHLHAVIFASRKAFLNEFYALAVDAYAHDADEHGRTRHRLLGVDADWLRPDGTICRGVLLDAGRNRLIEADLAIPAKPDSAQFLCLGYREQALHRALAAHCPYPLVNPWSASALADDKADTLEGWARMGLEIPAFNRIEADDWEAVKGFIARFGEAVLKPNGGTEGRDVVYLTGSDPSCKAPEAPSPYAGPKARPAAIIQQRRDGLLYREPIQGSLHTLALRLNVAFDGNRHRLSSGFAQIGRDAVRPAACGHGGTILPLATVLPNLVSRRDTSRQVARPDSLWWQNLAEQGERAAALFEQLRLVGLDVLLDQPDGDAIRPVFLEANPRPAGLCRSRLVTGLPDAADEPGIGAALWRGLSAPGSAPCNRGPGAETCRPPHNGVAA